MKTRLRTKRQDSQQPPPPQPLADNGDDEESSNHSSASSSSCTVNEEAGVDPDSFTCPICLSLMVKPVLLPCNHELCLACLTRACSGDWCSLACPLCRRRLSVWMRRARNPELLINADKWARIQRLHPRLQRAVEQQDDSNGAERRLLAQPGELGAEWRAAVDAFNAERRAQQAADEAASLALIRRLRLAEASATAVSPADRSMAQDIALADADIAADASEPVGPLAAPPIRRDSDESSALMDNRCRVLAASAAATPSSSSSSGVAYLRCDSVDSIGPELNQHFRPIQAMPLTPTKPSSSSCSSTTASTVRKPVHRPKAKRTGGVRQPQQQQRTTRRAAAAAAAALASSGQQRRRLLRSASLQETGSGASKPQRQQQQQQQQQQRTLRSQMSVVMESPANIDLDSLLVEVEGSSAATAGSAVNQQRYDRDEGTCGAGGYCLRNLQFHAIN